MVRQYLSRRLFEGKLRFGKARIRDAPPQNRAQYSDRSQHPFSNCIAVLPIREGNQVEHDIQELFVCFEPRITIQKR
jgi:hypothetical protein